MVRSLALLALAATAAHAQPRAADVVTWTARTEGGRRGAEARIVFEATLAPGWKLYALDSAVGRPLAVALDDLPGGVTAGPPRQSEPDRAHDDVFDAESATFSGEARIVQPLRVGRRARRGGHAVSGTVRYAVCDDEICLQPAAAPFRVALVVR